MEKQVAKIETNNVAEPITITNEDIKNLFCPLANTKEVALALGVVKSLGLNPFLREVYFIKYSQNDKMAIVVGYEVYIKRAERSGKLNGWKAGIKKDEGVAFVEIRRKDWQDPFYWEVTLSEFDKKQSTWKQIPSFMAKKVAIAQGFRLCFPEELGAMPYTPEENNVFDISVETEQPKSSKPVVSMPEEVTEDQPTYEQEEDTTPEQDIQEQSDTDEPEETVVTETITTEQSKANLQSIRECMAKCKTLDDLKAMWIKELKDYETKLLPSEYEKAVKSKDYFKRILENREKTQNGIK